MFHSLNKLGFLAFVAAAGCCPCRPQAVDRSPGIHHVKYPGETFTKIASWYTGSEKNWQKIAAANPAMSADKLRVGDDVRLPPKLMTRGEPMPENYFLDNEPKIVKRKLIRARVEPRIAAKPAVQPSGTAASPLPLFFELSGLFPLCANSVESVGGAQSPVDINTMKDDEVSSEVELLVSESPPLVPAP